MQQQKNIVNAPQKIEAVLSLTLANPIYYLQYLLYSLFNFQYIV